MLAWINSQRVNGQALTQHSHNQSLRATSIFDITDVADVTLPMLLPSRWSFCRVDLVQPEDGPLKTRPITWNVDLGGRVNVRQLHSFHAI